MPFSCYYCRFDADDQEIATKKPFAISIPVTEGPTDVLPILADFRAMHPLSRWSEITIIVPYSYSKHRIYGSL